MERIRNIKEIRKTIALLSSMVYSGESHSKTSEKAVRIAYSRLDELEKL